jgi:hypothetical protein
MQREEHEEINPYGECVEKNSNLLIEAPIPKRKAKGASIPDVDY